MLHSLHHLSTLSDLILTDIALKIKKMEKKTIKTTKTAHSFRDNTRRQYLQCISPQHGLHASESCVEDAHKADEGDGDVNIESSDLSQGKGWSVHHDGHVQTHLEEREQYSETLFFSP